MELFRWYASYSLAWLTISSQYMITVKKISRSYLHGYYIINFESYTYAKYICLLSNNADRIKSPSLTN